MEQFWTVVVVVGPILLLGIILWAALRNRQQRSRGQIAKAERGAEQLREEIAEDESRYDRSHSR